MAYYNQFEFAPAPWLPIQDRQVLDSVGKKAFDAHIGKAFDNPDFELSIVPDVNNYFAIDLFCRIRCSDVENKKLVVILPSPENAVSQDNERIFSYTMSDRRQCSRILSL